MLMKELKEQKRISTRLYKYLNVAFFQTPKNFEEYLSITNSCEVFRFGERVALYHDKKEREFANSSLEEVLKELDVSEPEDILRFRGLGKTSVSELQALIERDKNESKAI